TATIVSAFCFTMMGFIVASLSILSLFSEARVVKRYREGPYVKVLVVHIGLTLVELGVVFIWALSLAFSQPDSVQIKWVVLGAAGCLGMTLMSCLPLLVLQYRACHN